MVFYIAIVDRNINFICIDHPISIYHFKFKDFDKFII